MRSTGIRYFSWLVLLAAACPVGCTLDSTGNAESDPAGAADAGPDVDTGVTCGDGMLGSGEACDGTDLGGKDCMSEGFTGGVLGCAQDCTLDTAQCLGIPDPCGNGALNAGEACDGTLFGIHDCASEGFGGGTLLCTDACKLDTSGCTPIVELCENGNIDPDEQCDGSNHDGQDCLSQGFIGGTLGCTSECQFDTSACVPDPCGNDNVDDGEQCDGSNLAGETCETLGLEAGTLVCSSCNFDLTGCPGCGNGVVEASEACDGDDHNGVSCDGMLACNDACVLDATDCWLDSAGDGSDGNLVVDSNVSASAQHAPSIAVAGINGSTVQTDSDASAYEAGDEVILINMRGGSAGCSQVGTHEFLQIASVTGADVTFTTAIQETYGVGGNTDLTDQSVMMVRVPHFENVTVTPTGRLTTGVWDGAKGGVLAMRVSGELLIEAGGLLHVIGRGYRGGVGYTNNGREHGRPGESICGRPMSASFSPNDGGGGGGKYVDTSDDCGQGGGGGAFGLDGTFAGFPSQCVSHGASNPANNAGKAYGQPELAQWLFGSGGGAGASDDHSNDSGSGGRGGGLMLIFARKVLVDGAIRATGGPGLVPDDHDDSGNGGGGGSGGAIYITTGWIDGSGTVSANGGIGPASESSWNSAGGDGGVGRVRIDHHHAGGHPYGSVEASNFIETLADPDPVYSMMQLD